MSQSHRHQFRQVEITKIKQLLKDIRGSDRDRQKVLRGQLRRMGFYITDYATDQAGFTPSDVDRLVTRGVIKLMDSPSSGPAPKEKQPSGLLAAKALEHEPQASDQGPGHRRSMEWMGNEIETLEDLLRPGLMALCIGINPALTSVAIGHYYQGRLGQQFFDRLQRAGVASFTRQGWQDDEAFAQGIGFTDIVKRPTARADDVTEGEFSHGKTLLLDKISTYKPRMLIFSFKKSAQALFGPIEGNGIIEGVGVEGVPVFVMPGPYAKRDVVVGKLEELSRSFAG